MAPGRPLSGHCTTCPLEPRPARRPCLAGACWQRAPGLEHAVWPGSGLLARGMPSVQARCACHPTPLLQQAASLASGPGAHTRAAQPRAREVECATAVTTVFRLSLCYTPSCFCCCTDGCGQAFSRTRVHPWHRTATCHAGALQSLVMSWSWQEVSGTATLKTTCTAIRPSPRQLHYGSETGTPLLHTGQELGRLSLVSPRRICQGVPLWHVLFTKRVGVARGTVILPGMWRG